MELRDRWNRLLPDAKPLGEDLLARYDEEHRHYHDLTHLTDVLDVIDELADEADDPDAVRLAGWFHDAIYDPQADPGENEEVSAQLAELELTAYGVGREQAAEVARLVRLTADHRVEPGDRNGAVLCDADLRILSMDRTRYNEYAAGIRKEYRHIPDRDFARGRTAVLERLVSSPLYATERAHEQWEQTARANVERELAALLPQTVRAAAGFVPLIYLGSALGATVAGSVLIGRGIAAAPSWPAPTDQLTSYPVWAPIAGTAAAAAITCAWFRRAPVRRLLLGLASLLALGGAAGIAICWWRWPEARLGAALSERWPYFLLGAITLLLAGGLLGFARRLRATPLYAVEPHRGLGLATTVACGVIVGSVAMAAGAPFVQARLEKANTVSTTASAAPGTMAVQLDGKLAWTRETPASGTIAGTAGGIAELRPDGVVMSDATTGEVRWRYSRADVDGAADGGSRGLLVSADGRTLAAHLPYGGPGTRSGIDLPTYAVLDAVSGRVLADVHTDGVALAVDGDRLLVAEGNHVASHGVSQPTHWRVRSQCKVTQGTLIAGQAVVVDACGGSGAVVRSLGLETGQPRWEVDLGGQFELSAELDPQSWVGQIVAVPDTRQVSGLLWTAAAGGTLNQWSVDVGEGRLTWSAPVPGTPRPRLGPRSCDAQLTATRSSLVLVSCRSAAETGQPVTYDVASVSPADGTPQWHHLLPVLAHLQHPGLPRDGFAQLPDGRMVTLMPQPDGSCAPVMIGTGGVQPRPLAAKPGEAGDVAQVTCNRPIVAVVAGRPVFSDGNRLMALG
jgi:predicted metal-dependent HD superfamily phosphohydrolase